METKRSTLSFQDLFLHVLHREQAPRHPGRSDIHAMFFQAVSNKQSEQALKQVLRGRLLFNRWRNGPVSEEIDQVLDDLLFFKFIRESDDAIEISPKGREYVQESLPRMDGRLLERVSHLSRELFGVGGIAPDGESPA